MTPDQRAAAERVARAVLDDWATVFPNENKALKPFNAWLGLRERITDALLTREREVVARLRAVEAELLDEQRAHAATDASRSRLEALLDTDQAEAQRQSDRIRELEYEIHHMETVWLPEKVAQALKDVAGRGVR